MCEPMTCSAACHHDDVYCDNCDLLVGLDGLHVVGVVKTGRDVLVVTVESAPTVMGCPMCGVVAHSHGRRTVTLIDIPCFGRQTRLRYL